MGQASSPGDDAAFVRPGSRAASRSRRSDAVIGISLMVLGVGSTIAGTLLVALVSRAGLDAPEVPGGFVSAAAVLTAGVVAIVIGNALRRGARWARLLVLRRR